MALIKCTECGKQISSRAEKCPNCGCPIKKELPKLICPECGKEVSENDTKCTICGCPSNMFKTAPISSLNNESSPIVQQKKDEDSKKQLSLYNWWPAFVVLIVAVIIGLSKIGGTSNSPTEYQSSSTMSSPQTDEYDRREVKRETRTLRANKMEKRGIDWKVCGTVTLTLTIEDGNARVTELNGHRCNLSISPSQIDYSDWCCKEGSYFYCFDCRL